MLVGIYWLKMKMTNHFKMMSYFWVIDVTEI
jgi:hypothetical protein